MRKYLQSVRNVEKEITTSKKIRNTILILLFGVLLGIFSKWLDNLSIDDAIWWQHILDILDLNNVFSNFGIWIVIAVTISIYSNSPLRAGLNVFLFFVGMTSSYHLYTILFSGFNPKMYMMIWYSITLITPILGYICWYAKGGKNLSIIIDVVIIAIMFFLSFSIGLFYFGVMSVIDTILFIILVILLYSNKKQITISFFLGIILAYFIRTIF